MTVALTSALRHWVGATLVVCIYSIYVRVGAACCIVALGVIALLLACLLLFMTLPQIVLGVALQFGATTPFFVVEIEYTKYTIHTYIYIYI